MLLNYLTTAVRAIHKDKQHFFLNLIGFSIGIAAAILMALFVHYEWSYDKQHPDSERVYLTHSDHSARGLQAISYSAFATAEKMTSHSQVEAIFKLDQAEDISAGVSSLVEVSGSYHRLNDFYAATSNILDFIHLDILAGDITRTLSEPGQLVLSAREAKRLFSSTDIVGRTLNHEQGQYRIGAVFKDLPENSHLKFDSLIHMPNQLKKNGNGYVYFKLLANTDATVFAHQLTVQSHALRSWEPEQGVKQFMVNMQALHLNSNGPFTMKKGGSATTVKICLTLSVILILIASINFINLNIAQSAKRAKEVGVRKALGATKGQLVSQFLTESFLVVMLAGLLAFSLVELALPQFNQMMARQLSLVYGSEFMLMTLVVILSVGLLSGLYPALFIASFSAKRVLSGDLVRGGSAILIRKLTLCLQGILSVGLIIAAASLYQQMILVSELHVGYEKSARLVVKDLPNEALYKSGHNSLFSAIKNLPGVEQVTASNTDLTNDMEYNLQFNWPNGEVLTGVQPTIATGYYAVETLGLELLAGRDFSPEFSGDWYQTNTEGLQTIGILVSRRMVALAGYQNLDSVIGLTLIAPRHENMRARVVGVIEDVKIGSARQQVLPVSFNLGFNSNAVANIVIKTHNANMAALSKQVQQLIAEELHLSDVQVSQISTDYMSAHNNEYRILAMVTVFSLLAIFLTCLGTFGLASFATLRRQKEVAIRKVLGASRFSIVNLLAKEFMLLVAVSVVIAYPLTYWLVDDWLANFNERIEQSAWVYFIAAAFITVITWLTVACLAFKTASCRPSLILRDE